MKGVFEERLEERQIPAEENLILDNITCKEIACVYDEFIVK